jgi:(4S)-4-hydroxy-5-phosphonooxypentane-2,3-dione isomerase
LIHILVFLQEAIPFITLFKGYRMIIIHVFVHVKPDQVGFFLAATLENARNSVLEPGIAQFDIFQQQNDPTRFVLIEAYRSPEATAQHKETAHYKKWRDEVANMMAEPRTSIKYTKIAADERG